MDNSGVHYLFGFIGIGWLFTLASIVIAVVGALFVYKDAENRDDLFLELHAIWWSGIALVFSIYGVALYWLLHHSTLAPKKPASDESPADEAA